MSKNMKGSDILNNGCINPITGSQIKKDGKTHKELIKRRILDKDGKNIADRTTIQTEQEKLKRINEERAERRRVQIHGSLEKRFEIVLGDIKTMDQVANLMEKMKNFAILNFGNDIKKFTDVFDGLKLE